MAVARGQGQRRWGRSSTHALDGVQRAGQGRRRRGRGAQTDPARPGRGACATDQRSPRQADGRRGSRTRLRATVVQGLPRKGRGGGVSYCEGNTFCCEGGHRLEQGPCAVHHADGPQIKEATSPAALPYAPLTHTHLQPRAAQALQAGRKQKRGGGRESSPSLPGARRVERATKPRLPATPARTSKARARKERLPTRPAPPRAGDESPSTPCLSGRLKDPGPRPLGWKRGGGC